MQERRIVSFLMIHGERVPEVKIYMWNITKTLLYINKNISYVRTKISQICNFAKKNYILQ